MSRTPRDSTYARVAAGGDYDADWEEHYAPPPAPNLKRAAQAPKKIATVGAAGPDRWARDDYYTADPYQSFAPLEVDSELSSSEDGTPRIVAAGRRPVSMCKGACARCGDSVWSNEPRVRVGRGYAHVRCPRAFDYYATTAAAAFRPRMSPASPADSWSTTPPSSPPQDYYASTASAVVGAGSPLQRLDSVQIDPLQRVPRVYSFEAMTSRSL